MDRLTLQGIKVNCFVGTNHAERVSKQQLVIHLILHLPATATKKAAASDNLQDTINYAAVLNEVKAAVEAKRYNLIETVAEDCATIILQAFPVQQVDVNVIKKPKEIMAQLDYVAVNISRQK